MESFACGVATMVVLWEAVRFILWAFKVGGGES